MMGKRFFFSYRHQRSILILREIKVRMKGFAKRWMKIQSLLKPFSRLIVNSFRINQVYVEISLHNSPRPNLNAKWPVGVSHYFDPDSICKSCSTKGNTIFYFPLRIFIHVSRIRGSISTTALSSVGFKIQILRKRVCVVCACVFARLVRTKNDFLVYHEFH